mmetsp:Transcript_52238/g.125068  ORF Transcript_52238/g.125068 Transcript_52238/m.125068 type:complete len:208 (+) Transcript_52238:898-1521(+)
MDPGHLEQGVNVAILSKGLRLLQTARFLDLPALLDELRGEAQSPQLLCVKPAPRLRHEILCLLILPGPPLVPAHGPCSGAGSELLHNLGTEICQGEVTPQLRIWLLPLFTAPLAGGPLRLAGLLLHDSLGLAGLLLLAQGPPKVALLRKALAQQQALAEPAVRDLEAATGLKVKASPRELHAYHQVGHFATEGLCNAAPALADPGLK